MEQALVVPEVGEVRWTVDLAAAGRVDQWAKRRALLTQEVEEMGTYFPRWVLTAGTNDTLTRCGHCGEVLICRDGKLRCVACGRAGQGTQLAWLGHLPLPVDGLPQALARIRAQPHPGYPLVAVGGAQLWLVPIMAFYPADWPRSAPTLRYDAELFRILGIAAPSAQHHIVSGTTMCLYGWGQWRAVTLRVVIQQRVVNHLASLLKIANGQDPVAAFAGKQHIYGGANDWGDYR